MRAALGFALGVLVLGPASGSSASRTLDARVVECTDSSRWEALIRDHVGRYEAMQIADLYKLIHQASMGSEHAVPSLEVARQWLADELVDLPEGPTERMVDALGEGGVVARIHLRPFLAEGGSPDNLLDAFVATASGPYGDRDDLDCAIDAARDLARRGQLPWAPSVVSEYLGSRAAEGYPAVHHSPEYASSYRPAYRVVAVDLVSQALAR